MTCIQQRVDREVADHELIDRLFWFWDYSYRGALSFQVRDSFGHLVFGLNRRCRTLSLALMVSSLTILWTT
jgi:hypothetical protein